jgi:lipoprotein-anchoring transpeptidase ErfK/SrfK
MRSARPRRWAAVAALAVAGALALSACSSSNKGSGTAVTSTGANGKPTVVTTSKAPPAAKQKVPVHVAVNISDGTQVGVGMPYIATFGKVKITDGRQLQAATTVTVNDQKVDAAWYCEYSDPVNGYLMECHLRTKTYWPAHAQIHVELALKGKSAGGVPRHPSQEYVFDNSLTSDFETGDARIVTVSNTDHTVTITDDGKVWKQFPTSLGAPDTPTKRGIKVIMEQVKTVCMHDIQGTYNECGIKWDSRVTYDGEYLHAAPWNTYNIDHGINSSNGCTNLHPADALEAYNFLKVGDPVEYPDATGPRMQMGQGFGDWNVTWGLWQTGGVIATS